MLNSNGALCSRIKKDYKKYVAFAILTTLILSVFFYEQIGIFLSSKLVVAICWLSFFATIVIYLMRDKIYSLFMEQMYDRIDFDANKELEENLQQLKKKEYSKTPISKFVFLFERLFFVNIIFFIAGNIVGFSINFNAVTAPIAILSFFVQMFFIVRVLTLGVENMKEISKS